MGFLKIFFALLFLHCTKVQVHCTHITFFEGQTGTGQSVNYTVPSSVKNCTGIPETGFEIRSITTDTCILFYPTKTCLGDTVCKVYGSTTTWPFIPSVQSWIPCSQEQLGLNVEIYNNSKLDHDPVAKYKNLCKCVNIPIEFQNNGSYVYTEGHQIFFYTKENCTGSYVSTYGRTIKGKSFQSFDRPNNCPLLNGVLTDINNFTRKKNQMVSLRHPEVVPDEIRSSTQKIVSVTFKGEDTKSLLLSALPWTSRFGLCELKKGLIIDQSFWETIWENETKFQNEFIEGHCKNISKELHGEQIFELRKEFVSFQNVNVKANGTTIVYAQRGYVTDYFEYSVFFNITGIWESSFVRVSADDLESALPQSGLVFVRKLDPFTVLAEAKASVVSYYPFSTLYQTSFQGSLFPDL